MDELIGIPVMAAEVEEVEAAKPAEAAAADPLAELDRRIRELEAAMGDLRSVAAQAAVVAPKPLVSAGRKTLGAPLHGGVALEAGSLDAAMGSLSIEQRIAVKSEMMRKGLL